MTAIDAPFAPALDRPRGRWLLPAMTSLFALLALAQHLLFLPRAIWTAQRLAGGVPPIVGFAASVPAWLSAAVAAALVAGAIHQRKAADRSLWLAGVALALNLAMLAVTLAALSFVAR